jgi:hypothetical protein
MATVGEIASWVIKSQAQGFNRESDVIPAINEVHKILTQMELPQLVITDPDTGSLPVLATQTGVLDYNAPAVDGQTPWCVSGVYTRWPNTRDYGSVDYNYYEPPLVNTTDYKEFGGNEYYRYQFVRSFDATEDTVAFVRFSRDPGETDNRFYLLMYRTPAEITSDRIQLQIPDRDGAHRLYFFPAVMKLLEAQNHGNYMEAVSYIEDVLKPKIREVLSSGVTGHRHRTQAKYY